MLVIVNPAAAQGKTRQHWQQVQHLLQQTQQSVEVIWTERPRHATDLARAAAQNNTQTVVCVGGDGTVNEVVNGLMQVGDPADANCRPTLAVIPVGTGADFAHSLGLTRDLAQSVQVALTGMIREIDIGNIACQTGPQGHAHFFANIAGFGFDAEAVAWLAQRGKRSGRLAYVLSVLQVLRRYTNKSLTLRIATPEQAEPQTMHGKFNIVAVANARYFGAGMLIAPQAKLNDGLLDVVLVGNLSPLNFLLQFPLIYRGTHLSHPQVRCIRARWLEVQSNDANPVLLEAEGELVGQTPAHVSIIPRALRIKVPSGFLG